jgi:hypothetical protein
MLRGCGGEAPSARPVGRFLQPAWGEAGQQGGLPFTTLSGHLSVGTIGGVNREFMLMQGFRWVGEGLSPTPMHFSQRAIWNREGMQTGSELNVGDPEEYEGEENMQFNLNRSFNFNT